LVLDSYAPPLLYVVDGPDLFLSFFFWTFLYLLSKRGTPRQDVSSKLIESSSFPPFLFPLLQKAERCRRGPTFLTL